MREQKQEQVQEHEQTGTVAAVGAGVPSAIPPGWNLNTPRTGGLRRSGYNLSTLQVEHGKGLRLKAKG
jgi:hypothetical protein